MDASTELQRAIDALSEAIGRAPSDCSLYLERGKFYHRQGEFDKALNDFIHVTDLSESHPEAEGYITMIEEIFAFRHMEIYNV